MNKIHNICKAFIAATISAVMVCACDSTANDIKIEAINGHYDEFQGIIIPSIRNFGSLLRLRCWIYVER